MLKSNKTEFNLALVKKNEAYLEVMVSETSKHPASALIHTYC